MEESDDNVSSEDLRYDEGLSVKTKPKKRSIVERELETNLTARVTSPITNSDSSSTSRYGRARRLKTEPDLLDTEKATKPKSPNPRVDKSPSKVQSPVYKMHASNSPIRIETPKRPEHSLENQIENIYTENISLSRFGSEEKATKSSTKKYPKVYIRKDLIQSKDKDSDETVVLIKNMFSPSNSSKKSNSSYSSEKFGSSTKKPNRHLDSVVKTLDFDGNKKKKVVERKSLSKNELFEIEAKCEYQVGDLAWARMGTYPFWPCIITRDPLSEMFVKKKLFGRIERDVLHVTFFGDNGRRGWIVDSMLRKFLGQLEFEVARTNFTPEAKKKDPKLYAAFFVSEKKTPSWQISVEEAETLLREPKRLRIDILNDMLDKSRQVRTTPKLERSKKVTRTNSDVSLSESLYDTLFSEDDSKGKDSERSRSKSRNRSLNVSEVVTACLDNMAAKTGITKIQRQSHMDRWLQKAKSKTPEKSQLKSHKIVKGSKSKNTTHGTTKKDNRKSSVKSQSESRCQPHQIEHDYSQKYCDGKSTPILLDDVEIEYENPVVLTDSVESAGLGIISKVESLCDKDLLDKNEDIMMTVINDVIIVAEDDSSELCGKNDVTSNIISESTNEKILEDPSSVEASTESNENETLADDTESMEVDNVNTEEEVVINLLKNVDENIDKTQENVNVPSNDCRQSSNNVLNTGDIEESMEVSEPKDIESNNVNEIFNDDLLINAFCVPSSDNKSNEAYTIEESFVHITKCPIDSKTERDKNQSENSNKTENFRRKSKRLSGKDTKIDNGHADKVSENPTKKIKNINISLGIANNITNKEMNENCDNKDGVNNNECDNEISSNRSEEIEFSQSKQQNRETSNKQVLDNDDLDENLELNKENTEAIESISPKVSPKRSLKFKLSLNKSAEKGDKSPSVTINSAEMKSVDCNLVEKSIDIKDIEENRDFEEYTAIKKNVDSTNFLRNSAQVEDTIIQNGFMEHDHESEINNIVKQNCVDNQTKSVNLEKDASKRDCKINEQNTNMDTKDNCDDLIKPMQVDSEPVILNGNNENDGKTEEELEDQNNVENYQTGLMDENISNTLHIKAETNSTHGDEDDFTLRLSTSSSISNTNSDNISEMKVEDVIDKKDFEKAEIEPDTVSTKSEDSEISIGRKRRARDKQGKNKMLEEPEFLKYLELRQDAVMDEHPELTQEDITNYLYKTWLYEENLKTDTKKADDIDHANLVKGLNQDTVPVKKMRKKNKVDKEKYKEQKLDALESRQKEKSKRKIIRPFYKEDFSDSEETVEFYDIFKMKQKSVSNENNKVENAHNEIENTEVPIEYEEDMEQDETDLVEEYFNQLTAPKPNLFKGLIREKVCDICERVGNLVKCKGCHSMFHVDCDRKPAAIVEVTTPIRGRKKKKKTRGRKAKEDPNGLDSESQSDEKSQDVNVSEEAQNTSIDEEESHMVVNVDEFESQLSEKMKELLDNPDNLDYDSQSNDELDWNDTNVGECKIVDIKLRTKDQEANSDYSDYKCSSCEKYDIPLCFVCKSTTSPKDKVEFRQRCQVPHCQKYYHLECLDHWPQTQFNWGEQSKTNKNNEYSEALSCPRHVCHTCVCDDPRGCKTRFSGDKLAKCVRCPATYHTFTKCLPAGTQILTGSHIICPRHYEHRPGKVPCHVNTGWCFICALGGSLICCEYCPTSFHAECLNIKPPEGGYMCEDCETGRLPLYGEMVWVKLGHYRWWPGIVLHPSEIPQNILAVKHSPGEFVVRFFGQYDHYWVNRGRVFPFQEGDSGRVSSQKSKIDAAFTMAMEHAQRACEILKTASTNDEESIDIASSLLPPHYVKIKVNKPCGSLCGKKIDMEESSLTQCECDPNDVDPCGPYTQCLNRMLLTECGPTCQAGDRCNNRAFEKRLYPKMVPYRTPHRGWGLKTLVDIRAGQFVIEYVGELLDEAEFRRRMRRKHDVRDENFYFLTLDKERMIDAGPKGNLARFMNHSCEPNCETQKWTVLGDIRVGLFAIYDIPANSELTFNYNLESAGIEKKRCMCGAKRCSGYIGAKPKQDDQPKKIKLPTKRAYKKRKTIEDSPSTSRNKPKNRVGRPNKPKELTEIEKDLLIIKNATNGISSDSECSGRLSSIDSSKDSKALKRKLIVNLTDELSPLIKKQKNEKSDEEKLTI